MSQIKRLKLRLLELLYTHNEEHVGSCFSQLEFMSEIFSSMSDRDIFVLSNGHAAYALYVMLESYRGLDADQLARTHQGHPNKDVDSHIPCTTGSLGQGICFAVGAALADRSRLVHVTISDGECAEGSVWEALRFIYDEKISNLTVHVNANGFAGYDAVDLDYLERRCKAFLPDIRFHRTNSSCLPFLEGLDAHYVKMSESEYNISKEFILNEC